MLPQHLLACANTKKHWQYWENEHSLNICLLHCYAIVPKAAWRGHSVFAVNRESAGVYAKRTCFEDGTHLPLLWFLWGRIFPEPFWLSTHPLLFTMEIELVSWLGKSGRWIGHLQFSIFLSFSSSWKTVRLLHARNFIGQAPQRAAYKGAVLPEAGKSVSFQY